MTENSESPLINKHSCLSLTAMVISPASCWSEDATTANGFLNLTALRAGGWFVAEAPPARRWRAKASTRQYSLKQPISFDSLNIYLLA
jgi:hypothetical protein